MPPYLRVVRIPENGLGQNSIYAKAWATNRINPWHKLFVQKFKAAMRTHSRSATNTKGHISSYQRGA